MAWSTPYQWSEPVPKAFLSPTDRVVEGKTAGTCLQGALIDIRWGQVCLERNGVGHLLDTSSRSVVTLNGKVVSNDQLQKALKDGPITVVARFDPESGLLGWLDGYTDNSKNGQTRLIVTPWKGPAYQAGEKLSLKLPEKGGQLMIPGVCHALDNKGETEILVRQGWDLKSVPVFWRRGDTVEKVGSLSLSGSGPEVLSYGPQRASAHLLKIPGWVDFRSASGLLDLASVKVTADNGAVVRTLQPGALRTEFELEVPGGGSYTITATAIDQLGRSVQKQWSLIVR